MPTVFGGKKPSKTRVLNHFFVSDIYIYIYSHELKLRMPFWKCNFEGYARRFLELEYLPTPCFRHLFLLQSDRLTAWVNISSWPKTLLPKA